MRRASPFKEYSGVKWIMAAAALIALLAVSPMFGIRYLPLHDYPFHLARVLILSQLDNPYFARFYEHGSFLLPNIGMDAVAVPLSSLLGAEQAARVFVALTLLTALFGCMVLHRAAHGRWSAFPLLAVLFLHNGIFRFGFFNYLFGMGLALAAAGWWMVLRPGLARFAVGFVCAVLLLWCHFEAFAVFATVVGGLEIGRAWEKLPRNGAASALSDLALAALPFLACLLLFWLVSPTADVASKGFEYTPGMMSKPVGGLFALSSGSSVLDVITVLAVLGVCGGLAFTGNLTFSRPLAFAVGAMVLAFFVVPANVMGALYADTRLAPALALLIIAALDIRAGAPMLVSRSVLGLAVLLGVVQAGVFHVQWRGYEAVIAPITQAIEKIEPGSTLFAATTELYPAMIPDTPQKLAAWDPPLKHVASFAVLGSPVFVPMTWADPTQQPLAVKPAYRGVYDFPGHPRKTYSSADLTTLFTQIEAGRPHWPELNHAYLLLVGNKALEPLPLPAGVSRAAEGERFVLLRLP